MARIFDPLIGAFLRKFYDLKGNADPLFLNLCEGIKPFHDLSRRADMATGRQIWLTMGLDNRHVGPGELTSAPLKPASLQSGINPDSRADKLWDPVDEDCWLMDFVVLAQQFATLTFSEAVLRYEPGVSLADNPTALIFNDNLAFTPIFPLATYSRNTFGDVALQGTRFARMPLRMDGRGASISLKSAAGGMGVGPVAVRAILRTWVGPKFHLPPGM